MRLAVQISSKEEWRSVTHILNPPNYSTTPFGACFERETKKDLDGFFFGGVTKTLAAATSQYIIDHWKPDSLFCIGTCGGVSSDLKPLDVLIATKTVQYDCIERMNPHVEPFFPAMTTDIDVSWIDFRRLPFEVTVGAIGTADQDLCHDSVASVLRPHGILAADWESGAIAKICSVNKIKCCVIRGITDLPMQNEVSPAAQAVDYRMNTPLVMRKILIELLPVLREMLRKTNDDG